MTVFSMIVVETAGGGKVTEWSDDCVDRGEREEGEGGARELAAAEKNDRKCRDMIGQ